MLSSTQWAYVAGLIDGEGSISMTRSANSFTLHIDIYTTSEALFTWLGQTFSYGQTYRPKNQHSDKHKPQLRWHVPAEHQESFLTSILPYLVIKEPQAKLALEFIPLLKSYSDLRKVSNSARKLTLDEVAVRQSFKNRLSELNKRGPN